MALDWSSWISSPEIDPGVRLTLPPAYFFKVPPSDSPQTLPVPSDHPTLAHPFTIPVDLYNAALSPNVPILAALGYATVVSALNSVNERRKYKPWAFSKTRFFKAMVITHNITLALYSAWTCVGMVNALRTSFYPPWEEQGLAGTMDSLCKIHGPRGPGSAAVFGEDTSVWTIANRFFHLGADGLTPDTTDVGRIWNQGLAFYGWLFYLSKFYEVIDTLIILAKGKKSSFLQTFHHAGAMICMWAGMRYMSPPIWMFVLVNSFIHSIMYTFYLCSAVGVKVPVWFKRTLTTLQITQFVVGASYAFAHLFIKYQSPISIPYTYHLGNVASSAVSTASAVATDDWQALLRKLALRAAGREGLAENVFDHTGHAFGKDAVNAAKDWAAREETRYRDELQWTNCLDTSGQTFAILLNVIYLMPLTWLFANFFIRSYLRRVERRRSSTASQKAQFARESVNDAARRSGRRLSQAFENPQDGVEDTGDEIAIVDGEEIKKKMNKVASKVKKEASNATSSSREAISNGVTTVKEESSKFSSRAEKKVEETISSIKSSSSQTASKLEEEASPTVEEAKQGMANTLDTLKAQADSLKAKAQDQYGEYVKDGFEKAKTTISSLVTGSDGQEAAGDGPDGAESSKESSQDTEPRGSNGGEAGDTDRAPAGESAQEEPKSESKESSQTGADTSTKGVSGTDGTTEEEEEKSADAKAEEKHTDREQDKKKEELSPKEQVQQKDSNRELKAEASTGDAKENDSPAEQSSTKDVVRETTTPPQESHKEEHVEQNSNLQGGQREDVPNQETGSEEPSGEGTVKEAVDTAQEAASGVADKIKDSAKEAQDVVSQKLQSTSGKGESSSGDVSLWKDYTPDSKDTGETQDYEEQKESWIHVPETSDAGTEKAKKGGDASGDSQASGEDDKPAAPAADTSENADQADSGKKTDEPEWFEKLTSGIDSPTKARMEAQNDDEEKKKEDKVLDDSENLRDHVVDENTDQTGHSDKKEDTDDKSEAPSKEEQDKIIDESEAVRDKVQDTESASTDTKEDATKEESAAGA